MQEQIERESMAITVKASKLTAQVLAKVLPAIVKKIHKDYQKKQTPHGKQSVKKLMNHNVPTNTIPIEGDKGLFEKIARKYHIDYAFHQTDKNRYLLLFKSGQADSITAAFAEYSKAVIERAKDKKPPVMERFKRAAERAEREKPKSKERTKKREVTRE